MLAKSQRQSNVNVTTSQDLCYQTCINNRANARVTPGVCVESMEYSVTTFNSIYERVNNLVVLERSILEMSLTSSLSCVPYLRPHKNRNITLIYYVLIISVGILKTPLIRCINKGDHINSSSVISNIECPSNRFHSISPYITPTTPGARFL